MDFLISQIVKEHAGPITDCSADQKSEANGRVQPLDYDFADGRRTILEIGGAEEDRTPDLLRARQALSQLSYGPGRKLRNELRSRTSLELLSLIAIIGGSGWI